jgi:Phosphatase
MKARNRPPRLDDVARAPAAVPPPPVPTAIELLIRARVAGKVTSPGPNEVRHSVERLDANPVEAWTAIRAVFGATPDDARIDAAATVRAARVAAARIGAVARAGGRIAFASSQPASLLGVHTALVRSTLAAGGDVDDADDAGPIRADGRTPRWLRWIDGVAVVTDGHALLSTSGPDAAEEWLFLVGRPALVVADGPFAAAAVRAALEVVAFAGLDRVDLAVSAARAQRSLIVPLHTGRPTRAYNPLVDLLADAFGSEFGVGDPEL